MLEPDKKPQVQPDYFVDTDEKELETDGADYQGEKPAKKERNYSRGNNFLYGQEESADD